MGTRVAECEHTETRTVSCIHDGINSVFTIQVRVSVLTHFPVLNGHGSDHHHASRRPERRNSQARSRLG
eukprot:2643131-Prymnesium_polylepis.1